MDNWWSQYRLHKIPKLWGCQGQNTELAGALSPVCYSILQWALGSCAMLGGPGPASVLSFSTPPLKTTSPHFYDEFMCSGPWSSMPPTPSATLEKGVLFPELVRTYSKFPHDKRCLIQPFHIPPVRVTEKCSLAQMYIQGDLRLWWPALSGPFLQKVFCYTQGKSTWQVEENNSQRKMCWQLTMSSFPPLELRRGLAPGWGTYSFTRIPEHQSHPPKPSSYSRFVQWCSLAVSLLFFSLCKIIQSTCGTL